MVSYWKTQWFRVLIGFVALGFMCYYLFQPGADESTLEGFRENSENACASLCFFITAMIWFLSSIIEYNNDRIELLEKKSEKYDACCSLVEELVKANKALAEANEVDRQYADHLNRKIESFILEAKNREKQK
jgi:hypothetical protein